jgi:anti-sigma-K factor RskA
MTDAIRKVSDDESLQAGEYALGVLQGKARTDFEHRMLNNPDLAAAVRNWDEHFISFTNEIPSVTPGAHVQSAIDKRLFGIDVSQQKTSLWNSLSLWRGLTAAAFVVAISMGAWTLRPVPRDQTNTAFVADVAAKDGTFKLVAYYDKTTNELRLNRVAGDAAQQRSFELWLIPEAEAPISMGILADGHQMNVIVPAALRNKMKSGVLAITDEPAGGSPHGIPTGALVASGPLTEV